MTWDIFLGIVTLVGFVSVIAGPFSKLSNTLGALDANFENIKDKLGSLVAENSKAHSKIWSELDKFENRLNEHDKSIVQIQVEIKSMNRYKK